MLTRKPIRMLLRRAERSCCACVTCMPLAAVYSLTTYTVWVEMSLGFRPTKSSWVGPFTSFLGFTFYLLSNLAYTIAVFTNPGSPLGSSYYSSSPSSTSPSSASNNHDYAHLPTSELPYYNPLTVSSTGDPRFCRKCQLPKPDRAHHCSTCKRCILKMDHHCPWLATCVGLRNYKAFLLFLIYVSIYCWICFAVSLEVILVDVMTLDDIAGTDVSVGVFILVVLGGVIGLVLSGFTGWHISLACRNQTTIESLERTRYLTPLREVLDQERRKVMVAWNQGTLKPPANMAARLQALDAARTDGGNGGGGNGGAASGQWTKDSDTNPGGFSHTVNPYQFGPDHLHELERHYIYVDDEEAAQLPHAFDLGWRNNLRQLFGDSVLEWFLPFPISISLCGGSGRRKATGIGMGNGWEWQVSRRFEDAKQRLEEKRKGRIRDVVEGWRTRYWAQALAQGARPGSAGGSAAAGIGQGGAWPKPKNPYAVAAAKRAEEEARLDLIARARTAADQDTELDVLGDGDGVSMKALDMEGRSIRRYN